MSKVVKSSEIPAIDVTASGSSANSKLCTSATIESAVFNPSALELKDDLVTGQVELDIGEINHVRYGSAHLRGTFLYASPTEIDYIPSCPEAEERAVQFFLKWCDDHDLSISENSFRFVVALIGALSKGDVSAPEKLLLCATTLNIFLIDDIEEKTNLFATYSGPGTNEQMTGLQNTIIGIMNGEYPKYEDLPRVKLPMLQPMLKLAYLCFELRVTCGHIKPGEICPLPLLLVNELIRSSSAFMTMTDVKWLYQCSERTYLEIRSQEGTFTGYLEWLALIDEIQISEELRTNSVFIRFRNAFAAGTVLINDFIGVQKEMDESFPTNLILRRVTQNRDTLNEAIAYVVALIDAEFKDMFLCSTKLLETFPDDENLAQYIQNAKYVCEGILHLNNTNAMRRYSMGPDWTVKVTKTY